MTRPLLLIRAPVGTRSGYGGMSRDITRHLIDIDKWDVKVLPCPWGTTPQTALSEDSPMDKKIIERLIENPGSLGKRPEIFVSITVPNEYMTWGEYNIGITAGIETTACSPEWIEGMNRMDLILTISEHSKKVLATTRAVRKTPDGAGEETLQLQKPIEVLHNCVHTDVFKKIPKSEIDPGINSLMDEISEDFCFLFMGHWLGGDVGADRKDVGMLTKVFLDTFRKSPKKTRPALILKTSGAGFSVLDREMVLSRLEQIKKSMNGTNLPSVYFLHGDLSDTEVNSLYNHPKIKSSVTFTKGEGFGRPLLEFTMTGKPIIASGWSGHLDFLTPEHSLLLGGKLGPVHPSAVWAGVINADTHWFTVDYASAAKMLYYVWQSYPKVAQRGRKLIKQNIEKFSYDAILQCTDDIFSRHVPEFNIPDSIEFSMPNLPVLQKIGVPSPEAEEHNMDIDGKIEGAMKTAQVPQEV